MKLGIYKYVLGAVVMLAMSAQSNAIELKLSPGLQVSQTGEMVTLDLVVSGLDPISTLIGDFDVDIGFDDASLNFTGFSFSDALGSVISNDFFDPVSDAYDGDSGLVSSTEINLNLFSFLFESDLELLQDETTVLATLSFDVLSLELGEFTDVTLASVNSFNNAVGFGSAITDFTTENARIVNPNNVSSPSVIVLFGAMLCAFYVRRKVHA